MNEHTLTTCSHIINGRMPISIQRSKHNLKLLKMGLGNEHDSVSWTPITIKASYSNRTWHTGLA